jgi:hypothetical protein
VANSPGLQDVRLLVLTAVGRDLFQLLGITAVEVTEAHGPRPR